MSLLDTAERLEAMAEVEPRSLETERHQPWADAAALARLGLGLLQQRRPQSLASMRFRHD